MFKKLILCVCIAFCFSSCSAKKNHQAMNMEAELFGVKLKTAKRLELQEAIKKAGAIPKEENIQNYSDVYLSEAILNGSSELKVYYTKDQDFASAIYTFPSIDGKPVMDDLRGLLREKYGKSLYSLTTDLPLLNNTWVRDAFFPEGLTFSESVEELHETWQIDQAAIRIKVWRMSNDKTTYLEYENRKNYELAMKQKSEDRAIAIEAMKPQSSQNVAF